MEILIWLIILGTITYLGFKIPPCDPPNSFWDGE